MSLRVLAVLIGLLAGPLPLHAQDAESVTPPATGKASEKAVTEKADAGKESTGKAPPTDTIEDHVQALVNKVQPAVVVVSFLDADGKQLGVGSGVIIREDGLIATNLHVLGEARPIRVRLFDKREFPVTQIFAHEKSQDLAIIKIDATGLPALELADSDKLQQGQPVVGFGNPQGLEHSVVTGVVSALRKNVDGMTMIQLAIPIERGNSGGPVVDTQGRIAGLLTLKSLVTDNLGYAVAINSLKPLLEQPNPIPMEKWLTIGVLNPRHWTVIGGARWSQRAGRLRADGSGTGFGGRSLCLSTEAPPTGSYDVVVHVRLREADGAAGLVVHSDGGDCHYGFYPSSGRLRITRFDGPTVYNWQVLWDQEHPAYRPDAWNELKIRVDQNRLQCLCNGELVHEITDDTYTSGQVGVAKFRHTTAEFKGFRIGTRIESASIDSETRSQIDTLIDRAVTDQAPPTGDIQKVATSPSARVAALEKAEALEKQATWLRRLAREAHEAATRDQIVKALTPAEGSPDLVSAALWIAALDNDELDVPFYRGEVDALANDLKARFKDSHTEQDKLAELRKLLFEDNGFHGSRTNYHSPANSDLSQVIDDREGLPITLSLLFMEVGRKAGLNIEGVGLPGHFIVRFVPKEGEPQLIDVFDGGQPLSRLQALARIDLTDGDEEWFKAVTPRAICIRILRNLLGTVNPQERPEDALRYVQAILAINPESMQERLLRAVLCYDTRRIEQGLADVDWILEQKPEGLDLSRIRDLKRAIESRRGEATRP